MNANYKATFDKQPNSQFGLLSVMLIHQGHTGELELISAETGRDVGYILGRSNQQVNKSNKIGKNETHPALKKQTNKQINNNEIKTCNE